MMVVPTLLRKIQNLKVEPQINQQNDSPVHYDQPQEKPASFTRITE